MHIKVRLIIKSHLNDFMIDANIDHIDFVKYLIHFHADLSKEIDPDDWYQRFKEDQKRRGITTVDPYIRKLELAIQQAEIETLNLKAKAAFFSENSRKEDWPNPGKF